MQLINFLREKKSMRNATYLQRKYIPSYAKIPTYEYHRLMIEVLLQFLSKSGLEALVTRQGTILYVVILY